LSFLSYFASLKQFSSRYISVTFGDEALVDTPAELQHLGVQRTEDVLSGPGLFFPYGITKDNFAVSSFSLPHLPHLNFIRPSRYFLNRSVVWNLSPPLIPPLTSQVNPSGRTTATMSVAALTIKFSSTSSPVQNPPFRFGVRNGHIVMMLLQPSR